jgi:integrase
MHLALGLLHDCLHMMFETSSVARLRASVLNIPFLTTYARRLNDVLQTRAWKRGTTQMVLSVLRGILRQLGLSSALVRATHLAPPKRGNDLTVAKKYRARPAACARLESWVETLRACTNNRSPLCLRNILDFYTGIVLPVLQLDLDRWPADAAELATERCQDEEVLRRLCGTGTRVAKKLHWLQLFLTHIVRSSHTLPAELVRRLVKTHRSVPAADDVDHHRFSREELEKLYKIAVKDELNELFFMTLATTGMRIGGFVKMKCVHVADLVGGRWQARAEGKTQEKGNKVFCFTIHKRVQELLTAWLNKDRSLATQSEYVFPGLAADHVCTEMFRVRLKRMCHEAGLQGKHLHPHALRHSYSHMLLLLGNPPDVVSKLLNHESVATTQKYYLKESSAELNKRANVPWMPRDEGPKESPVPDFLRTPATSTCDLSALLARARRDLGCAET